MRQTLIRELQDLDGDERQQLLDSLLVAVRLQDLLAALDGNRAAAAEVAGVPPSCMKRALAGAWDYTQDQCTRIERAAVACRRDARVAALVRPGTSSAPERNDRRSHA